MKTIRWLVVNCNHHLAAGRRIQTISGKGIERVLLVSSRCFKPSKTGCLITCYSGKVFKIRNVFSGDQFEKLSWRKSNLFHVRISLTGFRVIQTDLFSATYNPMLIYETGGGGDLVGGAVDSTTRADAIGAASPVTTCDSSALVRGRFRRPRSRKGAGEGVEYFVHVIVQRNDESQQFGVVAVSVHVQQLCQRSPGENWQMIGL